MQVRLATLAFPFLATTASAGHVWVVSDSAQFSTAIGAAQNGDIILLKGATYGPQFLLPPFSASGKSVSFVADVGANVAIGATLTLENASSATPTLLQGLQFSQFSAIAPLLVVRNMPGAVWIDRCDVAVQFEYPFAFSSMTPALVDNCAALVVHDSSFQGAAGTQLMPGGDGLRVTASNSAFYGCAFQGGSGGEKKAGGNGLLLVGGTSFLSGGAFLGGNGDDGWFDPGNPSACFDGAAGGDGLLLSSAASVKALDIAGAGGNGGTASGICTPGAAGVAFDSANGTLATIATSARGLEVSSPVREGETLTWKLSGQPGELAFLDYGGQPGFLDLPAWNGMLLLAPPFFMAFAGVVPASGELSGSIPIHELGPGVEGAIVWAQSGFFDGASVLQSATSATLLLDQAF